MNETRLDIEKQFLKDARDEVASVKKVKQCSVTLKKDHEIYKNILFNFTNGKYGNKLSDVSQLKDSNKSVSFAENHRTIIFEVARHELTPVVSAEQTPPSNDGLTGPMERIVDDFISHTGNILLFEKATQEMVNDLDSLDKSLLSVANDYCIDNLNISVMAHGPVMDPKEYAPAIPVKVKIQYTIFMV